MECSGCVHVAIPRKQVSDGTHAGGLTSVLKRRRIEVGKLVSIVFGLSGALFIILAIYAMDPVVSSILLVIGIVILLLGTTLGVIVEAVNKRDKTKGG